MHGFALITFGLFFSIDAFVLSRDVEEIETRQFAMPVHVAADENSRLIKYRLFVSDDRGRSWKHVEDYPPSSEEVIYSAVDDGLYWFAIQLVYFDGKQKPTQSKELMPAMKVFVNTLGRKISKQKSYGQLLQETDELHGQIEKLQKKLKELERIHESK